MKNTYKPIDIESQQKYENDIKNKTQLNIFDIDVYEIKNKHYENTNDYITKKMYYILYCLMSLFEIILCKLVPTLTFTIAVSMCLLCIVSIPYFIWNIAIYLNGYSSIYGGFGCDKLREATIQKFVNDADCDNNQLNVMVSYTHKYINTTYECALEQHKCFDINDYKLGEKINIYACVDIDEYNKPLRDDMTCIQTDISNKISKNAIHICLSWILIVIISFNCFAVLVTKKIYDCVDAHVLQYCYTKYMEFKYYVSYNM